jgi:hypothetical protein
MKNQLPLFPPFYPLSSISSNGKDSREYYQVSVYHFKNEEQKQKLIHFFNRPRSPRFIA